MLTKPVSRSRAALKAVLEKHLASISVAAAAGTNFTVGSSGGDHEGTDGAAELRVVAAPSSAQPPELGELSKPRDSTTRVAPTMTACAAPIASSGSAARTGPGHGSDREPMPDHPQMS